jgi:glycerophosphoryl diester phosphodiesterase
MATTSAQLRSDWNVRDHVPLDRFIIQSHRGAGVLAAENTLEAFELGWKLGCIPEADVRTSPGGTIVARHDPDFSPPLTKMADVLAAMSNRPQRRLYLDIKEVDLAKLAAEVRATSVERQVILASTDYQVIRAWKDTMPQSQTLLWMGGSEAELESRFRLLRVADFAGIDQLQIHTHVLGGRLVESDEFLIAKGDEIRRRGILFQSLPYGGTTSEIYWKLMDLGVMSFATDHPYVTLEAVRSYYGGGK